MGREEGEAGSDENITRVPVETEFICCRVKVDPFHFPFKANNSHEKRLSMEFVAKVYIYIYVYMYPSLYVCKLSIYLSIYIYI